MPVTTDYDAALVRMQFEAAVSKLNRGELAELKIVLLWAQYGLSVCRTAAAFAAVLEAASAPQPQSSKGTAEGHQILEDAEAKYYAGPMGRDEVFGSLIFDRLTKFPRELQHACTIVTGLANGSAE